MNRFCLAAGVLLVAVLLSSAADPLPPRPCPVETFVTENAGREDICTSPAAELRKILEETQSRETYLATVLILGQMGTEARSSLPTAIKTGDRLGFFKDACSSQPERSRLGMQVVRALMAIAGSKTPAVPDSLSGSTAASASTALEPAKIKALASDDRKNEPRVAIFTWMAMETLPEFIHADRQLSDMLAIQLRKLAEDNSGKLTILRSRKVEEYKNAHPTWRAMDLADIGKQLGVDYLIDLEINSMTLYEAGAGNALFRGRASININLIDVKHPDDSPLPESFTCAYPSEAQGPVQNDQDTPSAKFRQKFLSYMAKQLSYYFTRYPKRDTLRE
jgi:hypothetical protein